MKDGPSRESSRSNGISKGIVAGTDMYVVELFLPVARGNGDPVEISEIEDLIARMADRFGGATAFIRSPAEGLWKDADEVERDRIVIIEVMVTELDIHWWGECRSRLEEQFQQEKILLRATRSQSL